MTAAIALLVNPTAGGGKATAAAEVARRSLVEAGVAVSTISGRDAADAQLLTDQAVAAGVDAVVAVGGDGLVSIAVNAVAGTGTPLGIIPAGTGNDLAASLGLPRRDPTAAARLVAERLADGRPRTIDAVRAAGRWYGCVLSAGFDSRVTERANRMSWPRGRMRYNLAIVAELRVFTPLPFVITIDGERWETEAMLVAVGNARSYGAGMKVCPDAQLDDGLIDLTVLGPVSKPELLKTFPKVFSGTHVLHPAVTVRRGRSITLEADGVTAFADGEFLTALPVTCDVVPGALQVLA